MPDFENSDSARIYTDLERVWPQYSGGDVLIQLSVLEHILMAAVIGLKAILNRRRKYTQRAEPLSLGPGGLETGSGHFPEHSIVPHPCHRFTLGFVWVTPLPIGILKWKPSPPKFQRGAGHHHRVA